MTSSLQTLKLAHQLRLAGAIPAHTGLWAVENPLTNSTDRLKSKVIFRLGFSMHILS